MRYGFTLNILDNPAALERILRTIRHRGFTLTAMNLTSDQGMLDLNICVESPHQPHLLHNQLAKLHDVLHVSDWDMNQIIAKTADAQPATRQ